MLENISKMKGEKTPEEENTDEKPEETTEKVDTSKIEKMKTGGAKREISGYTPKKEGDDDCENCIGDYAPSISLNNEQNPEIEDFQIGDEVTITAFVTGMEYRTEKGETKCNITLSLKEK